MQADANYELYLRTDSSTVAYYMIWNPAKEEWQYSYILRRIRFAMVHTTWLRLIFREANKVADLLAKVAQQVQNRIDFCRSDELPREIQQCIFIDRIGIPCSRSSCK